MRIEQLMCLSRLAGLVILLAVTMLLDQLGASLGEALYLLAMSLVIAGYSMTEWGCGGGSSPLLLALAQ